MWDILPAYKIKNKNAEHINDHKCIHRCLMEMPSVEFTGVGGVNKGFQRIDEPSVMSNAKKWSSS
jgi:hypothetical protein